MKEYTATEVAKRCAQVARTMGATWEASGSFEAATAARLIAEAIEGNELSGPAAGSAPAEASVVAPPPAAIR